MNLRMKKYIVLEFNNKVNINFDGIELPYTLKNGNGFLMVYSSLEEAMSICNDMNKIKEITFDNVHQDI